MARKSNVEKVIDEVAEKANVEIIKDEKESKDWSTRKLTLWFAISVCLIYTLVDCLLTFINARYGTVIAFDPTLTVELFSFMKWVVGLGGGLSAIKIIKQKDNAEDEEEKG